MIYLTRKHLYFIASILIVLLFHGTLLINQSFYRTYDAIIHIFFGSHYAQSWFDPWEPRWYAGFTVFSYPPLGHQLIGALSWILDLRAAFVASCFLGALPPVDFLAVCFVLAIFVL